ncbi:MAG: ABC transporter permease subunit [Hydrococcus sp. Prado102]|jgi:osmoprotectant transport system permease protein|nr:ABC transporter permease subunit [Hydrococcus sp. Prado102]
MSDWSEIWLRTGEHLILVAVAMTAAIAIGIPLGILITRQSQLAKPILGIANAIQTIPSLAIFGFLIAVPFLGGIGKTPAIVALSLYALLPLIRNTYTGITSIDPAIREAARAMGMTEWQMLWRVEIPLALGVILAGVRVATVICVGIATIAAAIGGGGLGVFIFQGLTRIDNRLILAGAIPSAIIAIVADLVIGWLENYLRQPGQRKQWLVGLVVGIAILLGLSLWAIARQPTASVIIGSKNFTEQVILGEILARQIEAKTNLTVDRRFNLGGDLIVHEALKTGKIDGYVEYTGTAFTTILKRNPLTDPQEVYRQVKQAYQEQFQLEVFPSLGFENTFAIIIRQEDAQKFNLQTISEATKYTPQWKAGFGYEFLERPDGYPGLAKTYGLKFAQTPLAMDLSLVYQALIKQQVDLVAGNSTDGLIPVLNLTILKDDKRYFPPYEAVPIFNQKTLERYPQLQNAIDELIGKISASQMQQLNYQVDNKEKSIQEVAQSFLESK